MASFRKWSLLLDFDIYLTTNCSSVIHRAKRHQILEVCSWGLYASCSYKNEQFTLHKAHISIERPRTLYCMCIANTRWVQETTGRKWSVVMFARVSQQELLKTPDKAFIDATFNTVHDYNTSYSQFVYHFDQSVTGFIYGPINSLPVTIQRFIGAGGLIQEHFNLTSFQHVSV